MEQWGFKKNELNQFFYSWSKDQEMVELLQNKYKDYPLEILPEGILIKETLDPEEAWIKSLMQDINLEPLALIISTKEELDNQDFFALVPEKYQSLGSVIPFVKILEEKGLIFDFSRTEKTAEDNYFMPIDCGDFIKFIPIDQYKKETKVKQIIAELVLQTSYLEVEEWLEGIYARYLLNNPYNSNEIQHILDWLNHPETDRSITTKSLSFNRALSKADQWIERENAKMGITSLKDKEGEDIKTISFLNDYALVKLISKDSKKREAKKMHNCIGTYHLDNPDLYSVRYNGVRVASIDLKNNRLKECKGPYNKIVAPAHQNGVKKLLETINVDFLESNDLPNIGLKKISLNIESIKIPLLIDKSSAFFSLKESFIDIGKFLDGVKFKDKDKVHEETLLKVPEEFRSKAKIALANADFENYQVCPFTKIMVHNTSSYCKLIPKVEKILNQIPSDILNLIGETMESEWTNSKVQYSREVFLETAIKKVLRKRVHLEELLGAKVVREAFILIGTLFNDSFFKEDKILNEPLMIQTVFPKVVDKESRDRVFLDINKNLSRIEIRLREIEKFSKLSLSEIHSKSGSYLSSLVEPEECLGDKEDDNSGKCDNDRQYEKQVNIVEDSEALLRTAEDKIYEMKKELEVISSAADTVKAAAQGWVRFVLSLKKLDYINSKVLQPSLEEYKSILPKVDKFLENIDLPEYQEVEGVIDSFLANLEEYKSLIKEFSSLQSSLKRTQGDRCSYCNGESVLDNNCDILEEVDLSYSWEMESDYSSLLECISELEELKNEPRELKRELLEFFYLKS